jgi:cysteine desulfurase
MRTYLDHNATTPLRAGARAAVIEALDKGGNPSSIHAEGRAARAMVEKARKIVADGLGVLPAMVVFTGVGTEANNWVISSAAVERIIISAVEHSCVLEAARATGKPLEIVPVDDNGIIDLDALEGALATGGKALVSVMLANNETGVIQKVRQAASVAAKYDALLHTDAVQGLGKIPINFGLLGVDLMTLSAHKVGGPQGVGALIVKDGVTLEKLLHGGGQELGRRGGTENVAGIVGFAAAVKEVGEKQSDVKGLRDDFESKLQQLSPDAVIFGQQVERLPNTCFFAVPGMKAQTTLINLDLDGIAVSTGSACSSGKVSGSRVLHEMGVADELRNCALRVSFGWTSTSRDIDRFMEVWQRLVARQKDNAAA